MESVNRGINGENSTHIREFSCPGNFAELARSSNMGPELVRPHLEHFRDYDYQKHCLYPHSRPFLSPRPLLMQEAIYVEIEKERIRDEIIMSEIARRRALEAEVRRELMERELGFGRVSDRLVFGSPVRRPLLELRAKEQSLKERIVPSVEMRERTSGRIEIGGYKVLMGAGETVNMRISEVNPILEIGKEKERIILQAKPKENISGSKREVETPLKVDVTESPTGDSLRKKAKTEWTCDICHVSTTDEQGLTAHLQGKKHRSKEAAMKVQVSGKNYCIGFCPEKTTKPVQPDKQKLAPAPVPIWKPVNASSERGDLPKLQESQSMKEKEKAKVTKADEGNVAKKEKFKFWCEICQVGTLSEIVMTGHKKGKKHIRRVQGSKQNGTGDIKQ